jgi:hypothetical protein
MTDHEQAAIAEVQNALVALEQLLVAMRERGGILTQERIHALGLAMSLEMQRIIQVAEFLPGGDAQEAA